MTSQVAQDLRAAAEVLRRDGWCRAVMHDGRGCHCVAGALEVVVDPDWRSEEGWIAEQNHRFSKAVDALGNFVGETPTRWNDNRAKSADEVIAALEAAADAAEATS